MIDVVADLKAKTLSKVRCYGQMDGISSHVVEVAMSDFCEGFWATWLSGVAAIIGKTGFVP